MPPRHFIADRELQAIYERRIRNGPAFETLDKSQRAEFRLFVETRGVLWNPRWGLTGRLNAYDAFRNFTLGEQTAADWTSSTAKETSASRAARINAKMARITAKADAAQAELDKEQTELNKRIAAKLAGQGPRHGGGSARSTSEEAAKAKILKLQREWTLLKEAAGEIRKTFPGDPNVPGSFGIKKAHKDPTTGEKTWTVKIVYPLSDRKEKIIGQIQGILHPLIQAQVTQKLKQLPPDVANRIDPESVADKVVIDWGNDARLVEKEIQDGKIGAHASNIAGSYKSPGERREEEWFERYADAPPDRPYCDIVRDAAARIAPVIGSTLNRIKSDPTFGSPEVDVTGERREEDEGEKVTPVAEVPAEEEEEDPEAARAQRSPLLNKIKADLATEDPEAAELLGAMIGTADEDIVLQKLGWPSRKYDDVKARMQRRMRKYVANPRYAAALKRMFESGAYRRLLQTVFPGLFIAVPDDASYATFRKFNLI